jgi:3-oxoacyl-[acyl-carrier protein] reductase
MPERKRALVTGCGKGIGQAIARKLAQNNFDLVLVSRSKQNLQETSNEAAAFGGTVVSLELDLMNGSDLERLLDFLDGESQPVDVVVNNLGGSLATAPMASVHEWLAVWQFNVGIAHAINLACIPKMHRQNWGRIIHLSTLSATTFAGCPAYVSAKCAVEGYVKSMGRHLFPMGIVLSAVAPGAISVEGKYLAQIEKHDPQRLQEWLAEETYTTRLGQTSEVAEVVAFLASESAGYMAGSIVSVDGGG